MNKNHHWLEGPARSLDHHALQAAKARQAILTKPPGALGRLEEIALQLAAWQGRERPQLERIQISVFAGDHGVAREGVSAFPQSVTAQMIANMAAGGAAISVLAKAMGASLELVNLGTVSAAPRGPGIRHRLIAAGTANLLREPAMSAEQCAQALIAGRESVESAAKTGAQLFIGGEMGIGNTTAATALACALLDRPASDLTGPGTGLDRAGITHKIAMIDQALALHRPEITNNHNPELEALRRLGGLEIAALTGASIACAQAGIPVLVDGFISSVAALAAIRLNPGVAHWMLLAHASAEPGHRLIVEALGMQPLLDLGMRLGEGSGAAVAVSLLRSACVLHNDMATFADAGVSRH